MFGLECDDPMEAEDVPAYVLEMLRNTLNTSLKCTYLTILDLDTFADKMKTFV
jgi:hypothetical protein